jgi:hypothetical protein
MKPNVDQKNFENNNFYTVRVQKAMEPDLGTKKVKELLKQPPPSVIKSPHGIKTTTGSSQKHFSTACQSTEVEQHGVHGGRVAKESTSCRELEEGICSGLL